MSSASEESETARPALRVVRGEPTPEELAALTALLAATSGELERPAIRVRRGGWNDPALLHRPALLPGPNAWRASAQPR
jgi:hypothetical protein